MSTEQQNRQQKPSLAEQEGAPNWLQFVRKQVDSLRFGTVQITVHDSKVTEVVRAEKTRLERAQSSGTGINPATGSDT